jgi:hypothetical protein
MVYCIGNTLEVQHTHYTHAPHMRTTHDYCGVGSGMGSRMGIRLRLRGAGGGPRNVRNGSIILSGVGSGMGSGPGSAVACGRRMMGRLRLRGADGGSRCVCTFLSGVGPGSGMGVAETVTAVVGVGGSVWVGGSA